jgi:hypothetical protein
MATFFHVDGFTLKKRGGICSDGEKAGRESAEISIIRCGLWGSFEGTVKFDSGNFDLGKFSSENRRF